ncbi:MAG: PAS domain-containing sensor histidine kinase [Deltaproteobacteria bacterium]|nr:PAS domain-containing sensor histidine kinase [Deltaproteobacteria bacterium]
MAENKTPQNDRSDPSTDTGQTLRRQAEERLKQQSHDRGAMAPEETGRLFHELQVHQIELEMQNEELRRAQEDLETTRDRYFDLYDLAPVGYLTLSEHGLILEANLTATQMLGLDRSRLAGQPLSRFIFRDDQDLYYLFLKRLFEGKPPPTFELRMKGDDGRLFWVQMKTAVTRDSGGALVWRATLSDITERKKMDERLEESEKQLRYLSSELMTAYERERRKIAGDLHDGIAAMLSALKFRIEQLGEVIPDEKDRAKVQDLVLRVRQIIDETRRIMADLRPSVLDDLGIVPAIHWFCREYQKTYSSLVVEKQIAIEDNEIPDALHTPIFRIVQEAMNNIAKHSGATSVTLSLGNTAQGIELVIRDNGQGFDLGRKMQMDDSRKGLGLASMKERAELLGGTFAITTGQETGTTIRVLWPMASPA